MEKNVFVVIKPLRAPQVGFKMLPSIFLTHSLQTMMIDHQAASDCQYHAEPHKTPHPQFLAPPRAFRDEAKNF